MKSAMRFMSRWCAVMVAPTLGPVTSTYCTASRVVMCSSTTFRLLKREEHREALVEAATSGNAKFFLGTDSAPHARHLKEAACGCAGMYTAHAALELYATAFEEAGALDRLEGFASHFGADFYGLPRNKDTITLVREEWTVPKTLRFGKDDLVPLRAGETIPWKLA